MQAHLSYETFAEWVREVLNHLYDSAYLQTHPLANILENILAVETTEARHRSQALRRKMLDTIRTLYPQGNISTQSPDWRNYKIMELRYIQGLNWAEASKKLGLGKTLYYKNHALALEAVTQSLWQEYQAQIDPATETPENLPLTRAEVARREVERMQAQATMGAVEILPVLDELKPILTPLAQAKSVHLSFKLSRAFTVLQASRVMVRQALLNVMTYAFDVGAGRQLQVGSFVTEIEAGIYIQAERHPTENPDSHLRERQGLGLEICAQLMRQMRGTLYFDTSMTGQWEAHLVWSLQVNRRILIIDDNEGVVDLFHRYLAGYQWQITGVSSGTEARQFLAQARPGLIILDIMMPGEDGWELLMSFKADPDTKDIPIIVCSVFNEPQLAQTLGAIAYLPKPLNQDRLLQVLQPWHQVGASLGP